MEDQFTDQSAAQSLNQPQPIFLPSEKIEVIVTFPVFWSGGATNFFKSLCRERLQSGVSLLIVSPAICNDGKPVFRFDVQRNSFADQCFLAENFYTLIVPYLAQVIRIRVNSFHGLFFFSQRGCFELTLYQQITSWVLQLKHQFQCELIYYFHDFSPICPFLFLVSDQGEYCNPGPDTEKCRECLKRPHPWTSPVDPELDIAAWRKCAYDFLMECTQLVFFSLAGANLLEKVMPGVITRQPERLSIAGQQIEPGVFSPVVPSQTKKMVIGVIGAIHVPKGLKPVLALQQYIRERKLNAEIVVIGSLMTDAPVPQEKLTVTGAYEHGDLPKLIRERGVNVIFFPSIWPETYSRVVAEVQMMDLPLALYALGAPAERMQFYEKAALIPDFLPETTFRTLQELYQKWYRAAR